MAEIGLILIVAAVVLTIVALLIGRVGRATRHIAEETAPRAAPEPVRPRPAVSDFHVRGEEAQVFFKVPLPAEGADEVLAEVLLHEAVEVLREKRHSLPIEGVTRVAAFGHRDGEYVPVGHISLREPGVLPPPQTPSPLLQLSKLGYDPLEEQFAAERPGRAPGLAEATPRAELAPVGQELRIPRAVEAGLRSRGIEPDQMSAGQLVVALLELVGYSVVPAEREGTFFATKGGIRTYLRVVPHEAGDHLEVDERVIDEFFVDFASSGADRGLLVSDKYGPFVIHSRERREPRVRFVTRERLQHFVDALALG
jgi:hypothetical protein